ncbi:hypothetical protein EAX61_14270 [Dokdonia sinensis]|uniref:Right-handed parallel beta-helix repeat-containing protein n=1 Tax=Dokdonia sinensis TaxID=2479847 RepID=A0A3M0FUD5_9FLAO|nr:hypothetical protein [Dokdonia sinensis]RMB56400.1 hypothetical protein EAX61_14270 [Dokdonia sinensis]
MQITRSNSKRNWLPIALAILGVILLSFYVLYNNAARKSDRVSSSLDELSKKTTINGLSLNYKELLKGEDAKIYENSDLKVYAVNKSGVSKVIYAYKDAPKGREITDNFFLHLFVKDSTKLMGNARFINLDFFQTGEPIRTDNNIYYIFQRDLVSASYLGKEIPISDIAFIRTGRNKPGVDRSLDLGKIVIKDIPEIELNSNQDKIFITTKAKDFEKILKKRKQALDVGVLSSADGDLINGEISLNNGDKKDIEFRLKGDWPDHLLDKKKWSYRVVMKDGETFKGMRKFSIQHPKVRNYLWEWLLNKVIKDEEIIGLRYDYAEVYLKIKDQENDEDINVGLMAVEESFDKILIESNRKREGVIVAFDESLYWSDVKKERQLELDRTAYSKSLRDVMKAPIRVFNEGKVLSNPALAKQFETAKGLLEGLRQSKYQISEVFDMDKLTTFVAINNLFAGSHGLVWHNLRMYYNPITGKLEPISFDSMSGRKLTEITHYPFSENDTIYQKQVRQKLALVSSTDYINSFLSRHKTELLKLKSALYTEYNYLFDDEILAYNSNFIKKTIDPAILITSSLVSYDDSSMDIRIDNLTSFPVQIKDLEHKDGRKMSVAQSIKVIAADTSQIIRFKLNNYFVNAFVSKKNKKGTFQFPKDVSKLRIPHYVTGVKATQFSEIRPYSVSLHLDKKISSYKASHTPNVDLFDFISNVSDSILAFSKGSFKLEQNLVIPSGYVVKIPSGFSLDFKNNASIRSKSALICTGTKENPVRFFSSDGTGQGIFVTDASKRSKVTYTQFDNLSNPQSELWSVSGAVNFHESDVTITNSSFTNNRCEDALNIIRSEFVMTDTVFENTQSDSFDGDFVNGSLNRCSFINSGNDGIDVSGSVLKLNDITVTNPSDKAISAGENSTITGQNVTVSGGEIGVVSKDLSDVTLTNLNITDTRLGLSAFQKKSEYGVASIDVRELSFKNVSVEHLIEVNSTLKIDDVAVETVSNNVIDQMYGKEYGKSSR